VTEAHARAGGQTWLNDFVWRSSAEVPVTASRLAVLSLERAPPGLGHSGPASSGICRTPPQVRSPRETVYTVTSRTGSRPANLATIIAAVKDAVYLYIPEGRRDYTTLAEAPHLHGLD